MKRIILSIIALISSISLSAQSVVYVNVAATGLNNGSTWQNAYTNLDSALIKSANTEQLWVAKGTYKPGDGTNRNASFVLKRAVYGGFAGTETTLEERNIKANPTILSGDLLGNDNANISTAEATRSDNSYTVVTYNGGAMSGLIIEGGNANGSTSSITQSSAAGIYAYGNFNRHITDCIVRKNSAVYHSAIRFHRPGGLNSWLFINRCEFYENTSESGVIGFLGGGTHGTYLHIYNCLFHHNTITESNGALLPLNITNTSGATQGALHFEFMHNTVVNNTYHPSASTFQYAKRGDKGVSFHNALIYNNIFADTIIPFKERSFFENVPNSSFQFIYNVYAFEYLESPSSDDARVYFNKDSFEQSEFMASNDYHLKSCRSRAHFIGSYVRDNFASQSDLEGNLRDTAVLDAGCYMITGIPKVGIDRNDNSISLPATHSDGYWFVDSTGGRFWFLTKGTSITPHRRGIYGVIGKNNSTGCYSQSSAYSFFYTNLEEISLSERITVFPNPAESYFSLSSNISNPILTIMDVKGQILKTLNILAQDKVYIGNFPNGIYLIEIESKGIVHTLKLIKQ